MERKVNTLKKRFVILIFGLLLSAFFCQNVAAQQKDTTFRIRYKDYVLEKYKDTVARCFVAEVFKRDTKYYSLKAPRSSQLEFVAINDKATQDINQDGEAEFIFQEYIGGAKETIKWHILSLGKDKFSLLDTITVNYIAPWLLDLDKDSIYEILVKDYTFANWNAGFIESPFVKVVLSYQGGSYLFDTATMQKSDKLLSEEKANQIKEVIQEFYEKSITTYPFKVNVVGGSPQNRWSFIPPLLWTEMLEFCFAGKGDLALEFLDKSWYEKLEGKANFLADFKEQLSKSRYWEAIRQMNGWQ